MTLSLGHVMVNNYPVKFGSQKHCGSGDKMPLVVEEQDSYACLLHPLLSPLKLTACLGLTQNISD